MESLEGKGLGELNLFNPDGPIETWDKLTKEISSRVEKGKVSMSQSVTEKEDMSGKDPQSKTPHNVAFRKVHDELRLIKQASRDIKAHQDNIRAMLLALSVPCGTEKSCRKQAI